MSFQDTMENYDYTAFDDIADTFIPNIKDKLLSLYKTDGKATHTFMNGGKLNIPYDKLQEVYELLEKNKDNPPLTERINAYGDTFKFYIDLDDETADIKEVIKFTKEALNKIYNLDDVKYTIWKNKNKQKYHIIYQLKTNLEQALLIVEYLDMSVEYDIDYAVYKSGLRLPLCNKDTIQKQDNSIYEYFEGYKGSYLETGSILFTGDLQSIEYPEKAKEFLNSTDFKASKAYKILHTNSNENIDEIHSSLVDSNKLNDILNKMFDVSYNWKAEASSNGFKITHDGKQCLVDDTQKHDDKDHSCMFLHKRSCMTSCFSHNKKKILAKDYPELIALKETLGLVEKKKTKLEVIQCEFQEVELTNEDFEFINSKLTTTHEDVACIFQRFFKNKYICGAEVPKPIWYEYKDGLWSNTDGQSQLRKEFTTVLVNIFMTTKQKHIQLSEEDEENKDLYLQNSVRCDEICKKLKTTCYTDSLFKQIIHHFKYKDFIEELDKYRHLLCFGEDVYDLTLNEWRKTTPADLCSKKCNMTKDEVNNTNLKELMNIIIDIHTDEERREFFISSLSDLLYGKNTKELFHIWTGTGRNGKGVIAEILRTSFGDYYCSPSVSLITQKMATSTSANPELAKTRGARIVMFTEPEEGSKLNNSLMKQYTGGDELTTRALFCNPFSFTPHFTIILQCNTFQMQDVKDDSIPERLLFMKFKNSFVDEPTMDWQRKKDKTLKNEDTLNRLKGAMMFLLIEKWRELSPNHNFKPPQSVIDDKMEFLDDNNNIKQFVDENIEFTENQGDMLKAKELMADYKMWMEDRNEKIGKMTLKMFINRMSKYMPEYKERHQPRANGNQSCYRNVFLRCKINGEN